jgi:leucyl-tRNA synthetase
VFLVKILSKIILHHAFTTTLQISLSVNSEKKSKSTGNFRTIRQEIEEFSADATRFSLADAGDGVDNANFVFETANAETLRLTKELVWYEEMFRCRIF